MHAVATGGMMGWILRALPGDRGLTHSRWRGLSASARSDRGEGPRPDGVWGGIHFRTADVRGAVTGKKVADYLRRNYFQPTR
jgi:hypothetical protein